MLSAGAAGVDSLNISYVDIFVKLLISFLVPTLAGKALREFVPAVFRFQREHKVTLSIISNTNLVRGRAVFRATDHIMPYRRWHGLLRCQWSAAVQRKLMNLLSAGSRAYSEAQLQLPQTSAGCHVCCCDCFGQQHATCVQG